MIQHGPGSGLNQLLQGIDALGISSGAVDDEGVTGPPHQKTASRISGSFSGSISGPPPLEAAPQARYPTSSDRPLPRTARKWGPAAVNTAREGEPDPVGGPRGEPGGRIEDELRGGTDADTPTRKGRPPNPLTQARENLKQAVAVYWRASNLTIQSMERCLKEHGFETASRWLTSEPDYFGQLKKGGLTVIGQELVLARLKALCGVLAIPTETKAPEKRYADPIERMLVRR